MRIDSSGNVGIGTSSPDRALDVRADPAADWQMRIGANNTDADTYDIGRDVSDGLLYFNGNQSGFNGYVFGGVNGERMRIDSSGNVGIGTTSPSYKIAVDGGSLGGTSGDTLDILQLRSTVVNGSYLNFQNVRTSTGSNWETAGTRIQQITDFTPQGYIQFNGTGNPFGISFGSGSTERMRLESDGDLHADGDVIAYSTTISDERLKNNIVGIENALDKVNQLNGYTFEYKADGKISAGVIAQEVEKVLPEAVSEKELPLKTDDGEQYKVVNYDALHGLLIEAIKELKAEIEELKNGSAS
jgi:hypothetical protein